MESFVQEAGRAGQDGLPCLAVLVKKPSLGRRVDKAVSEYANNETSCRETYYFQTLIVTPGHFKDSYVCVVMCV